MKALNLTSEFDEKDVMETFKKYLTATLDVSHNYTPLPPPPLNLTSEFDEKDVMETFKKYLTATLDVSNTCNWSLLTGLCSHLLAEIPHGHTRSVSEINFSILWTADYFPLSSLYYSGKIWYVCVVIRFLPKKCMSQVDRTIPIYEFFLLFWFAAGRFGCASIRRRGR